MSWLMRVYHSVARKCIRSAVDPDPLPGPFPLLCTVIRLYRSPSNVLIIHIGDVINRVRLLLNRLLRCPENGRRPFATDSSLTHTGRAISITSSLTVVRPPPLPFPSTPLTGPDFRPRAAVYYIPRLRVQGTAELVGAGVGRRSGLITGVSRGVHRVMII